MRATYIQLSNILCDVVGAEKHESKLHDTITYKIHRHPREIFHLAVHYTYIKVNGKRELMKNDVLCIKKDNTHSNQGVPII